MTAFAEGMGEAPKIIEECGKETEAGVKFGRMEMSYFLGMAYAKGASVPQDAIQATQWLQRAAGMGSRSAETVLAQGGATALGSGR
jgi:TPR repeat protein